MHPFSDHGRVACAIHSERAQPCITTLSNLGSAPLLSRISQLLSHFVGLIELKNPPKVQNSPGVPNSPKMIKRWFNMFQSGCCDIRTFWTAKAYRKPRETFRNSLAAWPCNLTGETSTKQDNRATTMSWTYAANQTLKSGVLQQAPRHSHLTTSARDL